MKDLDVNILVQAFSEKIGQLITELVVKEATVKQLNLEIQRLLSAIESSNTTKKQTKKETDDFEWGKVKCPKKQQK